MKADALPEAITPYFTCESSLRESLLIPEFSATFLAKAWSECLVSTDSMYTASLGSTSSTEILCPKMSPGAPDSASDPELPASISIPTLYAPLRFSATKRYPLPSSCWEEEEDSDDDVAAAVLASRSSASSERLGHPRTPRTGSPSSRSASAMAYWRFPTNPLVPSMGSRTQCLLSLPPSLLPSSIASRTSASVSSFSPDPLSVLFTKSTTLFLRSAPSSLRKKSESSSATRENPSFRVTAPELGKFWSAQDTMAWAPRSATVTGLSSLSLFVWFVFSFSLS
mmetsp:Transcript_2783/g.10306  ORF Transcript_2783/g.10306 Transcript_2783/m.10306 type:complete len:282 (-) Transcript_2783:262-1107(-)